MIGIVFAAAVAACAPSPTAPTDTSPAARGFFEDLYARRYDAALARVAPNATYVNDGGGREQYRVEDVLGALAERPASGSRFKLVDDLHIPGVVVVQSRVIPADGPVQGWITVLTFEGGCITGIRTYQSDPTGS